MSAGLSDPPAAGVAALAGRARRLRRRLRDLVWGISGPIFGLSDTRPLAIPVKLDESIRATHDARNAMVGIEHLDDRRVQALEQDLETRAAAER